MEKTLSYIPYRKMNRFVNDHANDYGAADLMTAAAKYFISSGQDEKKSLLFGEVADVLSMSENDFEEVLERLPIELTFLLQGQLQVIDDELLPDFNRCHVIRVFNDIPTTDHRHPFFEITYLWRGDCYMECEGISYDLKEGDFLIVPPGKVHNMNAQGKDSIILNLLITREAFQNTLLGVLALDHAVSHYIRNALYGNAGKGALYFSNLGASGDKAVRIIIKMAIAECYTNDAGHVLMIDSLFAQLICMIIKYHKGSLGDDFLQNPVDMEIMNYIEKHFHDVSMQSLAERFGYTEAYLCRRIKKNTGKTFSELLRAIRIEKAKFYLNNTKLSVKRIGELVGYNTPSAFIHAFQKEIGVSPSDYRIS